MLTISFKYISFSIVGVAFELPSQPLAFAIDTFSVCTDLIIINNATTNADRSALLGVEARLTEFQVMGDITTVTFIDEPGLFVLVYVM